MLIWREVETWKEREMRLAGRNMRGVTLGLTTPPRHGGGGSGSGRGWMMVLPRRAVGGRAITLNTVLTGDDSRAGMRNGQKLLDEERDRHRYTR